MDAACCEPSNRFPGQDCVWTLDVHLRQGAIEPTAAACRARPATQSGRLDAQGPVRRGSRSNKNSCGDGRLARHSPSKRTDEKSYEGSIPSHRPSFTCGNSSAGRARRRQRRGHRFETGFPSQLRVAFSNGGVPGCNPGALWACRVQFLGNAPIRGGRGRTVTPSAVNRDQTGSTPVVRPNHRTVSSDAKSIRLLPGRSPALNRHGLPAAINTRMAEWQTPRLERPVSLRRHESSNLSPRTNRHARGGTEYASGSEPDVRKDMRVQVPPCVPINTLVAQRIQSARLRSEMSGVQIAPRVPIDVIHALVAQRIRAFASEAKGRLFKSARGCQIQLTDSSAVEHRALNPDGDGSIPSP
jgi:hypothetical protein